MNMAQFMRYLDRDGWHCLHCGTDAGLVPQHRIGGMGGRRSQEPSNIITFCGHHNGLIESDAAHAEAARNAGWKLRPGQDPLLEPVYDRAAECWFFLDNDYHRTRMD
jgi:hypothetical protein